MKTFETEGVTPDTFMNAVATFNADPYLVEDEELCNELFEALNGGQLEEIDDYEFNDAVAKLGLEHNSPTHIYRCGEALVCLNNDYDI